jgi:signal transduction histidine kinase
VTLELESAAEDVEEDPSAARERVDGVIDRLSEVIKDMRRYMLGLQPADATAHTLPQSLAALLAETRAHTMLETDLSVDGDGVSALPAAPAQDLLQIAREAVANVVRHAHAGRLWVTLDARDQEVRMRIVDNGVGFDPTKTPPAGHDGLRNLQERARGLGGAVTIRSAAGQGTVVDVRVPVEETVYPMVPAGSTPGDVRCVDAVDAALC